MTHHDQSDVLSPSTGPSEAKEHRYQVDRQAIKDLGTYGSLGFEFAVFIVLGVKGGQWLDNQLGTSYLTLVGLAVGLGAGFRALLQLSRRYKTSEETSLAATNTPPANTSKS